MPYLTPLELPEDDDCRPLSIPANSEWLALFGGALTELTKTWNWEDSGGLTVAETVEKMQSIIGNWYTSPCEACTTPGGYRVIRINTSGHLEQLDENGDWVDATDEYHIPPPEAREGGTEADQICLAAKNAVNVLQQLYENLSDSFNEDLAEDEAVTAFILALIALVGFEFAPITWGIVAFFAAVFSALYSALEFIVADLWDSAVSQQITCFLVECATNDDGVVTFDYTCFTGKLNSLANDFSLTEDQLRLYLQISYLLYFIGGMDGLNLAGATTEITDDDCSDCVDPCFIPQVGNLAQIPCTSTEDNFLAFDELGAYSTISPPFSQGAYVDLSLGSECESGWNISFSWINGSPSVFQYATGIDETGVTCIFDPVDLDPTSGLMQFVPADHPIVWIGWAAGSFHITQMCIECA